MISSFRMFPAINTFYTVSYMCLSLISQPEQRRTNGIDLDTMFRFYFSLLQSSLWSFKNMPK